MALVFLCIISLWAGCNNQQETPDASVIEQQKKEIQQLEYNWLKAEFALDTAYLSTIIDESFMGISSNGVSSKHAELRDLYNDITQRMRDSVFIDSFRLEEVQINIYGDAAVATFIVHTSGKNKTAKTERRTRFYDTWIRRGKDWKAVSSQGTRLTPEN